MNCFTGKPAANTREAAEKAQWSEAKLSANWGWLLGGQNPCTWWWNPITSAKSPVLGEPVVMCWEQLSDLTAVTSVLCLPMGGFLASHLGAEGVARQEERRRKTRREGGATELRQEETGCKASLSCAWLLFHLIRYPHYPVPGQMHHRKHW